MITIEPRQKEIEKPYMILTEKEFVIAAWLLNSRSAAFILYCYFAFNADGYSFALSPTNIEVELGISGKQYDLAKAILKKKGYLVPQLNGHDEYKFVRVPEQYRDINLQDIEFPTDRKKKSHEDAAQSEHMEENYASDVLLGSNAELLCASIEIPISNVDCSHSERGYTLPPEGNCLSTTESTHQTLPIGGRNNITKTSNITYTTDSPEDKKDIISEWEEKIRIEFEHEDQHEDEILTAEWQANRGHYSQDKHIKFLEKAYNKLKRKEEMRIMEQEAEYRRACEATMPNNFRSRVIIWNTLDRLIAEGRISSRYGVWIQGWDEEHQEVIITEQSLELPLEKIKTQKHIIEDIPDWYWKRPQNA